jgi:uncharacterized protein (DUF1778 family)
MSAAPRTMARALHGRHRPRSRVPALAVASSLNAASVASSGHLPDRVGRQTTLAHQDRPDTTPDARLEALASAAQKNLLQPAAALCGRTLSEFVVASAQDAARRVIAGHESIRLSREEPLAFVKAPLNPQEPNARRKRAAQPYRQRTGAQRVDLARTLVEPLGRQHDRTALRCGTEAPDRYLKQQARQDADKRVAASFVAVSPPDWRVLGY